MIFSEENRYSRHGGEKPLPEFAEYRYGFMGILSAASCIGIVKTVIERNQGEYV